MRQVIVWLTVAVVGGVSIGGAAVGPAAADDRWLLGTPLESPALADEGGASLAFTPRLSGVFDLESARMSVTYTPLVPRDTARIPSGDDHAGFAIGGALEIDHFVLEGGLARSSSAVGERERLDAAIGFGGFTTRLHLMDTESATTGAGTTRFGVGAELSAAPGLSLGAGLNFSDNAAGEEDDTSGVVRFRVRF